MKRIVSVLLLAVLLLSMTSCELSDAIFENSVKRRGASLEQIISFLNYENVSSSKYSVASSHKLSVDELCAIFKACEGSAAKRAMDTLRFFDIDKAYEIAYPVLEGDFHTTDSAKLIYSMQAVSEYFIASDNATAEQREGALTRMLYIFENTSDDRVRSQTLYVLDGMCDYELFAKLIETPDLTYNMKQNLVESNIELMKEKLQKVTPEDDISAIITAMNKYPVIEVGKALKAAVAAGRVKSNREVRHAIEIAMNGH